MNIQQAVKWGKFHISENKEGYYIAPTYLNYDDTPD